jgi:hypothetical protein
MKTIKVVLIIAVLVSLSVFGVNNSWADGHGGHGGHGGHDGGHHGWHGDHSSFFVGIGFPYPWYCYDGYYPYPYGWHSYWAGGYYYPYPYYPQAAVTVPVVVERPAVVVAPSPVVIQSPANTADEQTLGVFAAVRAKKGELLRQLRIGDKAAKLSAIEQLAGLSYDDQVKETLKDILLKDADPDLRREAAKAFGDSKNAGAISILEEARVKDSDEGVRREADNAINKIKK